MGLLLLLIFALLLLIAIGTVVLIHGMTHPERRTYASALAHDMATEPAELNFVGEAMEFRFDDGTMSPGWIVNGTSDNGVTIIFTHGWSDSRYGGLSRVPELAAFASRIVVYDMRGHGDSTAKQCGLSIRETGDLLALMDQVDDGGPMILWGSSMGAGITIAAAAAECTAQQQVDQEMQRKRLLAVVAEGPFRFPTQAAGRHLRIRRVPPQPIAWLAEKHFAFWQGETRQSFDRAAHAANVTCPLLIMHGAEDDICPIESSRAIAAAAPNSEFVAFDGAMHEHLARYDETRYRETLEAFFKNIDGMKPASAGDSKSKAQTTSSPNTDPTAESPTETEA